MVFVALVALLTRSFIGPICHVVANGSTAVPSILAGVVICTANGERTSPSLPENPAPADHDAAVSCAVCFLSHELSIDTRDVAAALPVQAEPAKSSWHRRETVPSPFARGNARSRAPPSAA